MSSIEIEIVGVKIAISQETVDAFEEHSAYCSAGTDWLVRFDPKAHKEQELIESVKDAIKADFDVAISGLTEEEKDNAEEEFFDLTEDDWWDDLAQAIEASK
jgi:hypothetical protein